MTSEKRHGPDRGSDPLQDDESMGRLYAGHVPVPPTPVEAMWRAIEAELPRGMAGPDKRDELSRRRGMRAVWWSLAAGIVLALGVALGRASMQGGTVVPDEAPVAMAPSATEQAYAILARERVGGIEPLLTMIAADARRGDYDPQVTQWAGRQLTRTRLALGRPGADDPAIRALLQDLELILAQVATLDGMPPERAGEELGLIARAMDDGDLLARVRAVRSAGP